MHVWSHYVTPVRQKGSPGLGLPPWAKAGPLSVRYLMMRLRSLAEEITLPRTAIATS